MRFRLKLGPAWTLIFGLAQFSNVCFVESQSPLVCSCTDFQVCKTMDWAACNPSRMCRAGAEPKLEYWDCAPGFDSANMTGCEKLTVPKLPTGVNIVTQMENTIIIRVVLSQKATYIDFSKELGTTSGEQITSSGVTWKYSECQGSQTNALGEPICHNDLIWRGRAGSLSEDEGKYSCITASLDNPTKDQTFDDWSCEYRVCRVLCTTPTLAIKPVFLSQFEDVKGTAACAPGSFLDPAGVSDSCYKYKSPLHVGETLTFELTSTSFFTNEDLVDIQAAVEPGIPNGLEFAPNYQIVGGVQVAMQYMPPFGSNTRTVRWTPRPGQQGRSYVASFVGFIPPADFGGRGEGSEP